MKTLLIALLSLVVSANVYADSNVELPANDNGNLPSNEKAFVKAIPNFSKDEIIKHLGEPAKKEDFTSEETGEIFASIWEYNSINTDENGNYYASTELDFVGDKVNVVVFMNDNSEKKIENIQPMENSVIDLPTIR